MKRILGAAMTLALVLGVTVTSFAGVGGGPKTKHEAPAAKHAVLLKNKDVKQTKHRKHRRHHKMRRHHRRHKGK